MPAHPAPILYSSIRYSVEVYRMLVKRYKGLEVWGTFAEDSTDVIPPRPSLPSPESARINVENHRLVCDLSNYNRLIDYTFRPLSVYFDPRQTFTGTSIVQLFSTSTKAIVIATPQHVLGRVQCSKCTPTGPMQEVTRLYLQINALVCRSVSAYIPQVLYGGAKS